ncbi:hypothetical protein ABTE52_23215, partial [Acinetobacter baumannii]
ATIRERIRAQVSKLAHFIPSFDAAFPIYLAVAPNFDAKGALTSEDPNSSALVLALDSLALEHADLDVLLPHELFHA